MRNILLILTLFILSSCGQAKKKDIQEDYTGTYKTDAAKGCAIELIVTKQNDGYHYKIKTSVRVQEGLLEVAKIDQDVYFRFNGLLGTEPKDEIEGQYTNDTIIIQNYGSSMNQYLNFSECDIKFLELLKIKNK
jgi:hypothetical protein